MAKSTSLFPDPPFHLTPAADRTEPRVWVRQLVVVAERSPSGEVIRRVHRGFRKEDVPELRAAIQELVRSGR